MRHRQSLPPGAPRPTGAARRCRGPLVGSAFACGCLISLAISLSAPASCRAQSSGGPVSATPHGAPTQPGRPAEGGPTTAPATQPTTSPDQPLIALGKGTITVELPTLSGRLFDSFGYTFHGQTTIIPQFKGDFPSPYQGPNSFRSGSEVETSYTGTLFTGVRLLPGTEIHFDPEVAAGSGLSGVFGLGDPTNGETPRVSSPAPSPYIARLFLKQTFGFGGEQEDVNDAADQIAGKIDVRRLTITVGKFAANDIFDNNTYARDPRSQFQNWGLFEDTAWDYPADTKGYTEGLALELNGPGQTLRYGIFREPRAANGGELDNDWGRAYAQVVEYEKRYTLGDKGRAGVVRPMAYINYAHMGDYRDAIDLDPTHPNVIATRSYDHPKYGVGVNVEQALTDNLGIFGRAGWNNGQSETWAFTEVDRTLSVGLSLKGAKWGRPDDVYGLGGIMSGLSRDHRDYLAAGGLGFELGDGRLSYAPEEVIETYYLCAVTKNLFLTLDYQFVDHPGYNAARGPVSIGAFRVHGEF
jgi:high affinity Mn2+ porin